MSTRGFYSATRKSVTQIEMAKSPYRQVDFEQNVEFDAVTSFLEWPSSSLVEDNSLLRIDFCRFDKQLIRSILTNLISILFFLRTSWIG